MQQGVLIMMRGIVVISRGLIQILKRFLSLFIGQIEDEKKEGTQSRKTFVTVHLHFLLLLILINFSLLLCLSFFSLELQKRKCLTCVSQSYNKSQLVW